ncbi:MAG: hypothetical protein AAGA56_26475, partial [Myxococcota bacterium]
MAAVLVSVALAGAAVMLTWLSRSPSASTPAAAAVRGRSPSNELQLRQPKFFRSEDSSLYVVGELFNAGDQALGAPAAA